MRGNIVWCKFPRLFFGTCIKNPKTVMFFDMGISFLCIYIKKIEDTGANSHMRMFMVFIILKK